MLPLVRVAFDSLNDPDVGVAVKSVAITTLLSALEQGLDVPAGVYMAIWKHLLATDGNAVVLHRYELIDEAVARDAIRVLRDPNSGEGACDLAVAVLKGSNVRLVANENLVGLADRMTGDGKVRRLTWLVERVHEERGLSHELLVALRDRLAASDEPITRSAAVEVAGLAARLDEVFAARMFGDEAPPVRTAVAEMLERADMLDRPLALAIVRRQLEVEGHRTVLSALYGAMASLVRGGRRVRTWETPTGGQN